MQGLALFDDIVSGQSASFEAINPARNMARGYQLSVQQDLFGHFTVDQSWGRLGTRGQSRRVSFVEQRSAESFLRQAVKRRATAERRNGVAYSVVDVRSDCDQMSSAHKLGYPSNLGCDGKSDVQLAFIE